MIPNDVYKAFIKTGTAWANAHCEASQLEDQLKSMLAQFTLEAKEVDGVNSMAEAKEIALSASRYREAIRDAVEARREANIAKVTYEATKSLFDAQRTAEASARAAERASP